MKSLRAAHVVRCMGVLTCLYSFFCGVAVSVASVLPDDAPESLTVAAMPTNPTGLADDERFATTDHPNLNVWFYASSPPLVVPIEVTRVFSKNGLDYPSLLTAVPQLVIRAYDVDSVCPDPVCEFDEVFLNGQFLGFLTGHSGRFSDSVFDLDPAWFSQGLPLDARFNGSGLPPSPGHNLVQVVVNVAGGSRDWKVQIVSVELRIRAMRPAVLIHGMRSDSSTWNTFKPFIPGDLSLAYDVGKHDLVTANAGRIMALVPSALTAFGTSRINLIGHSKGGLIG
ncbi:MAG: hypothetical protein HY049_20055 [Acidobacteria bacterium]|nr:hypothetical protein [Acidobacteriota bacterium]